MTHPFPHLPPLPAATCLLVALAGPPDAQAQSLETGRPYVPAASVAAENGPGALWVNPANLAYDPDPRAGLFLNQGVGDHRPNVLALTGGFRSFALGVKGSHAELDGDPRLNWSLDYGAGFALPGRLSLGALVSWNLIPQGRNFAALDLGASWRPTEWLGLGVVTHNLGDPDLTGRARARHGAGFALRPFGPALVLGLDYSYTLPSDASPFPRHMMHATARIRPVEGLYLRANLHGEPEEGLAVTGGGLGLEVYFGGVGLAGHYGVGPGGAPMTRSLWAGTDEPGEALVRSNRKVSALTLTDAPPYVPRMSLLSLGTETAWLEVLERLRAVEEDPSARGLLLQIRDPGMSWAHWRELRARLAALDDLGKPTVVHLLGSNRSGAYYAASAATEVWMHPAGDLQLVGISSVISNARGALGLLGIEPQFVRRDQYKSGPETFSHTEPTAPNLEQTHALLDDLYEELVKAIAEGRELPVAEVAQIIDRAPLTAREAEAAGLIDGLAYPDQVEERLAQLHEGPVGVRGLLQEPVAHSAWDLPDRVAVLYIEGAIVPGQSSGGGLFGPRTTGSDTLIAQLGRAAQDRRVKAVVLRVDSPGGSAYASDEIWRAVRRLREQGKPVVVSMGGVAASGGYYVAAGGDAIWAQPNTLTGSIGVYSGKMVVEGLLDEVGVNTTILQRGRNADIHSPLRPWDGIHRERMLALIDEVYDQFIDRVVQGREMEEDAVRAVAGGRIWSGKDALDNGLVDAIGGLPEAISDARARAGLDASDRVELWSPQGGGSPLQALGPSLWAPPLRAMWAEELRAVQQVGSLLEPLGATLVLTQHPSERAWLLVPELVQTPKP